jgi:hypothetical protein
MKVGADDKGVFNIPQPSGEELITRLLDLILKQDDPERSFVKFKDGDDLVLLVNNQGGMSALEMGAVVDETLTQLGMSSFPSLLRNLHLPITARSLAPPRSTPLRTRYRSRLMFRNPKHHSPQNPKRPIHGLNEHARHLSNPPQPIQRVRRM